MAKILGGNTRDEIKILIILFITLVTLVRIFHLFNENLKQDFYSNITEEKKNYNP